MGKLRRSRRVWDEKRLLAQRQEGTKAHEPNQGGGINEALFREETGEVEGD